MKKIIFICWKDLLLTFQDKAAWILMLAAPLVLILGMGAVTGALSPGASGGLQDIPVILVNRDEGQLGNFLVEAFGAEELSRLFQVSESQDEAAARRQVEDDQVAAVVLIPAGFSASILPGPGTGQAGSADPIEIYTNPARPISASAVQSVVREIVNRIETGPLSGTIAVKQLVANNLLSPQEVNLYAQQMAERLAAQGEPEDLITLQPVARNEPEPQANAGFLAYLAPGMAVFFLMYTVTYGGRSLLAERDQGTLHRLLSTPTSSVQVLGGKVLSIFITGFIQVGALILASSLLFGLRWGNPLGVFLLVIAVTAAATGWGILLASFARTPFQVSSIGTAIMLFFGILGGTFIPASNFSGAVSLLSKITPNAWAMDGFGILAEGGGLAQVAVPMAALLLMAAALFACAVLFSRRRWASGFLTN